MSSKLAVIAFTGFAVAAVCIGGAAAIGARQFGDNGFDFSVFDTPSCGRTDGTATTTTRDLDWDGSDRAVLSVPAHASYTPGSDERLHLSGDPALIAHVRVRGGRIEMDCRRWHAGRDSRIAVTLPGRRFRKFAIAGSGALTLNGLDQDRLKVSIAGSGSIHATGHVEKLDVHIAGSGDADMGNVTSDVAKVHIAGSGNADIAPRDEADIHIAGSGDVNLHSYPRRMDTHVAGSGRIRNVGGGI
jgi:hypothetical protein